MDRQVVHDFMISYIRETVHLEMDGPAHQLARYHGLHDRDFGRLVALFPQVQRDFLNGQYTRPIGTTIEWPWPGKAGAEVITALEEQIQRDCSEELYP